MNQLAHTLLAKMAVVFAAFAERHPTTRKQDFVLHDHAIIHAFLTQGSDFIWVLTPYGTHLTPVGLHAKTNEWAFATVECAQSAGYVYEIYHVTADAVRRISEKPALTLAHKLRYITLNGRVHRASDQKHIGNVTVDILDQNLHAAIHISSIGTGALSLEDLVALGRIANDEAIIKAHSFWVKPRELLIDGEDLHQLIAQRRAAQANSLSLAA